MADVPDLLAQLDDSIAAVRALRGGDLSPLPAAHDGGGGPTPQGAPAPVATFDGSESSEGPSQSAPSTSGVEYVASDPSANHAVTAGAGVWGGDELDRGGLAIEQFRLLDQDTGEVAEHVAYLSWERGVDGRHRYVRRTRAVAELVQVNLANAGAMRAAARKIHEQLGARKGRMTAEERWLAHAALRLEAEA